jgi:hypothetical protein
MRAGGIATLILTLSLGVASASAPSADGQGGSTRPITGQATSYGLSPAVRDLSSLGPAGPGAPAPSRNNPLADEPDEGRRGTWTRGDVPTDPLAGKSPAGAGRTPPIGTTFDGTANPAACGGCSPPDTIGDVGPNHYIQMVNATKVAIYNKAGTLLTPIFDLGTLFTGTCASNDGDPVVLYDEIADRWLLSQFASPSHLCFAISQTSDPLGSYFTYTFNVGSFPDYFKVGVWPSGYYVSANESSYTSYAFNRTKMLAGDITANFVKFTGEDNFLLPADVDGPTAPAVPGTGLFYTFKDNSFHGGSDRIELFELTPDFTTPVNSTFTLINTFPVTAFTYTVCGFFNFDCIEQPGTTQNVDAVSEWPMHRFPYRNFGDHEALVGNFTVGGGTGEVGAAIRWFELRNTGSGWTLFQQGTHDEGGVHDRFMGSIAIDKAGNIALGYSVSSNTLSPSIRYATRAPGDTLGTLQTEQTLQAGGGSQTGSDRWGDYSAMSVDPADDCAFWYTNEYYNPSSATNWKTRIGTFEVPGCDIPRTLTVSLAGTGTGTVTGPGINCPGDCTEVYSNGQVVTLTASAPLGSAFAGWTNCDSPSGNQCTETMDANDTVTATFNTVPTHTLTVATAGTGSGTVTGTGINCPGDCTETYNQGSVVTMTATPAGNSSFAGWTNCDSPSGNQCMETMDAPDTVTATFNAIPTWTLSVSVTGTGAGFVTGPGIACPGDCSEVYNEGTMLTLNAAPVGSTFAGWSGDCTGTGSCALTMSANRSVSAVFTALLPPILDTTPPNTRIRKGPKKETSNDDAKFRFTSSEPGSRFKCKLVGRKFKPCTSPKKIKNLDRGKHTFKVKAIDAAGNRDPSPARRRWKIVEP